MGGASSVPHAHVLRAGAHLTAQLALAARVARVTPAAGQHSQDGLSERLSAEERLTREEHEGSGTKGGAAGRGGEGRSSQEQGLAHPSSGRSSYSSNLWQTEQSIAKQTNCWSRPGQSSHGLFGQRSYHSFVVTPWQSRQQWHALHHNATHTLSQWPVVLAKMPAVMQHRRTLRVVLLR